MYFDQETSRQDRAELSFTLNTSTDYLLLGRNPDREQDRRQLLQVISQLSCIARNM